MKTARFWLILGALFLLPAKIWAATPRYEASPSATIKPSPTVTIANQPVSLGINLFNRPSPTATPTATLMPTATIKPKVATDSGLTVQPQTGVESGVWLAILAILFSGLGLWRIAWVRAKGW